jgi:serine/threonine protein phosphatase 1
LQRSVPAPRPAPAGTAIYAIGDIHGRLDLLLELRAKIAADAARRRASRRILVHLGDYVDRGPDAQRVLDLLISMPMPGFQSVHLRGNHEQLMLDFAADAGRGLRWFVNGGLATLASYGLPFSDDAARPDRAATARLHDGLLALLPRAHRDFLAGLPAWHRVGDYVFVHAGIRPGAPMEAQDIDDLLWIREPFLSANNDPGFVVVHGHTVAAAPQIRRNRIGIDTGAYATGVLTALAIEGDRLEVLQTGPLTRPRA